MKMETLFNSLAHKANRETKKPPIFFSTFFATEC